ncbi:MAG: prepilin-type N-terminal cleavage/methylation domain-containing protein [Armatimonadetes bacterium]|nr:prepilin-type N-terminal cleavage/methylation domain-containing protein [Armatimonadota bacterium]
MGIGSFFLISAPPPGRVGSGKRNGFSLLELVLAIFTLGILLMFVIGVFTNILGSTTKGANLTAAVFQANYQLDEFVTAFKESGGAAGGSQGSQGWSTTSTANQTTFYFYIPNPVPIDPAQTVLDNSAGRLYRVEVEVWWWNQDKDKTRAGQGKLSTRLSKLIYIQR